MSFEDQLYGMLDDMRGKMIPRKPDESPQKEEVKEEKPKVETKEFKTLKEDLEFTEEELREWETFKPDLKDISKLNSIQLELLTSNKDLKLADAAVGELQNRLMGKLRESQKAELATLRKEGVPKMPGAMVLPPQALAISPQVSQPSAKSKQIEKAIARIRDKADF